MNEHWADRFFKTHESSRLQLERKQRFSNLLFYFFSVATLMGITFFVLTPNDYGCPSVISYWVCVEGIAPASGLWLSTWLDSSRVVLLVSSILSIFIFSVFICIRAFLGPSGELIYLGARVNSFKSDLLALLLSCLFLFIYAGIPPEDFIGMGGYAVLPFLFLWSAGYLFARSSIALLAHSI